jgi:SAM-dependent methyltransferase
MRLKKITTLLVSCIYIFGTTYAEEDVWDAETYIENSSLQYQWGKKCLKFLNLKGNESVLDIGCGDGRITALIATKVPQGSVTGIDISDSMLAAAHDLCIKTKLKNLRFLSHDAMTLPFTNEFDCVVSFSCLHWVSDQEAAIKGIAKALKPGGKIFLYFAPDHGEKRFDHSIDAIVESLKWKDYFVDFESGFHLITPRKLIDLMDNNDLLLKRIEVISVDETFKTKDDFIGWMMAWMTHLKRLPVEMHRHFVEEILHHYLSNNPPDVEGNFHYYDYWLEVEAEALGG